MPKKLLEQADVMFGGPDGPVVSCTVGEDMCRQEYALKSDIRYQISQYGVGHPLVHGEVDFDNMDLTRAYELVERSSQMWLGLPKLIRDRYQSWANVEAAMASGELEQLMKAAGAEGGGLPSAAAASPSESAAASA